MQRGLGFGLTMHTAQTEFMSKSLGKFPPPPFRTSSLACLLFTAEVKAIPLEQTVQLREKNSHSVPLPLWQCLDYKSGDSI